MDGSKPSRCPDPDGSADIELRRRRITDALALACLERGYRATTTSEVARRAGLPREALDREFPDKGAIAAALLERVRGELLDTVTADCGTREGLDRIDAAVTALLSWVERNPPLARAWLVERFVGADHATELQAGASPCLAARLAAAMPRNPRRPSMVDEFVVGGVEEMLRHELRAGRGSRVTTLLPGAVEFARRPYQEDW